jgi:hypothetical protein
MWTVKLVGPNEDIPEPHYEAEEGAEGEYDFNWQAAEEAIKRNKQLY